MSVRYARGEWYAVATTQGLALLPPHLDLDLVEEVWRRLKQGKGLGGVLESLTGAFGTSLSEIPPFAVVVTGDGDVRVAVRGGLEVRAETDAGTIVLSGAGVTTWNERMLDDPRSLELSTVGGTPGPWPIPLVDGVALASGIRIALRHSLDETAPEPVVAASPSVVTASVAAVQTVVEELPASEASPVFGAPAVIEDPIAPIPVPPVAAVAPVTSAPPVVPVAPAPPAPPVTSVPPAAPVSSSVFSASPPPVSSGPAPAGPEETWSPQAETSAVEPQEPVIGGEFDDLWGATVARPITDAAVHAEEPADEQGDHDGETVSFAQVQRLRAGTAADTGPTAVPPPPPVTATLVVSTGEEVTLDRPVVIGRRPSAVRVSGGAVPHLVAVDSPQQDISRNHVEVRREDDALLAVDLDTTNGTVLIRAGRPPVRLHPGEPTIILEGDVLDLGDGITLTFRDIG